jgi:putative transposase
MPRAPRIVVPGVPLHIVQRGNNRARTFRDEAEFTRYLDALSDASRRFKCAIHAYVLMSNHVHLLVTPEDRESPARMMQTIGRRVVPWINARHERTGTLWEGRFRSSPVDSERYLFTCSRYIELNPVRAGLAAHPSEYRWSSHRCNAAGEPDPLISPHARWVALGATTAARATAYGALFRDSLPLATLAAIRLATRRGAPWGGRAFPASAETTHAGSES